MSLIVNHVSKTYQSGIWNVKKVYALKDVSFSLESGSVLALVGQNGAGKTTLIKCMLDFIRTETGSITIDGSGIKKLIQDCQVGYMPERLLFPSRITLSEYISDLMVLRGKSEDEYQELFDTYIQKFYMTKHMNTSVEHFSKGTTKKAAFIQAVLHQPNLLILDEPTDGLDPVSRRALLNEINELKKAGSTVIITTHLLSDISLVADEVIVLQNGCVVRQASVSEISSSLDDWYLQTVFEQGGMEL